MAKQLVITYGGVELYNDEPANFSWCENSSGAIKVEAGPGQTPAAPPNPLAGLLQRAAKQAQQQPSAALLNPDSA